MSKLKRFLRDKTLSGCVVFLTALVPVLSHALPVPVISNFSPKLGIASASVTISGTNFSATASSDIVYFGAVKATVSSASATNLTVTVPVGATYAPITVTVGGLTAYANAPFLVTYVGVGANNSTALAPRLDLPVGNGPGTVAFADLDGDGKPDLVVLNGGSVSIYQNISTNDTVTADSFAPRVDLMPLDGLDQMTAADVDGDGKLDIVVLNRDLNQVIILQNLSTPGILTTNSFAAPVAFPTGSDPRGLAVRDLDGDGKPEIVVGNWGDNTVSVFHNIGAGGITTNSFAAAVNFDTGANPQNLAVADLDGDGEPDIVTANNNYDTDNSVSILRNTSSPGDISFANHVDLTGMPTSYWIAVGDLDGDGKLDVVISSFINGQAVSVYRNTSTPGGFTTNSFAPHVDFSAGGWGNAVAIGDLDGDGKPDLAVVTQLPDHLSIFKNISTPGGFTTSSLAPRVDYPTGWNPNGVAIGDLDGDGRPDIAFGVSYAATLSIYQNQTPFGGPPLITSQPVSRTNIVGTTASFSVTAGGTQPLSYQWSCNATNLADATNATLTLANVQLSNAGNYIVTITNLYGATNSAAAVLSVNPQPSCMASPSGLAAWWEAEGNAMDSIGGTTGTAYPGTTYANGTVGQAFSFDGVTGCVMNTNTPSLTNIQNTFTMEFWAYPQNGFDILQEGGGAGTSGQSYAVFPDWGGINSSGPAGVGVSVGTNGISVIEHCNNYMPSSLSYTNPINGWVHVAVVYSNKQPVLYVNGVKVRTGVTSTETFVYPSKDLGDSYGNAFGIYQFDTYGPFRGLLDEVSIYNRALSATEIAAIYNAGSAGKCVPTLPPTITTQPVSRTNIVGTTASFSVTAGGTQPLSYQWSCNATNIIGATNVTLTLSNVQLSNAGNYIVAITNLYGSTNSATAVLSVSPPPSCTSSPSGLVEWWPGEGNANDIVGGNNGTLTNGVTYGAGEVGSAFILDGVTGYVQVPASPILNVGAGNRFTFETWINPTNLNAQDIAEWNDNAGNIGAHLFISGSSGGSGPAGCLYANLYNGVNHIIQTGGGLITANSYQHVAVTYDKTTGVAVLYRNGVAVQTSSLGSFTPQTSYNFYMGTRPSGAFAGNFFFHGAIDEPSLYNRALSQSEIQTIYNAGSGGKCPPSPTSPTIIMQPVSRTNIVGTTASFSVTTGGTQPLSYQWSCNATNLVGATNATLTLTNVQLSNAGNYSVLVTNLYGATNSSTAALTVTIAQCVSAPSGLVAWWQAEGNGNDSVGTNNAAVSAGVTYVPAEVGLGFNFNGGSNKLAVPDSPSLNFGSGQDFSIEAWIQAKHDTRGYPYIEDIAEKRYVSPPYPNYSTSQGWEFCLANGQLAGQLADQAPSGSFTIFGAAGPDLRDGKFHHVALTVVRNSTTGGKLYVDGQVVTTFDPTSQSGSLSNTNQFLIGNHPDPGVDGYFNGIIDEVSLYNRALSSNEIVGIYNAFSAGKCPPPPAPPTIVTQPVSRTNIVGTTASFSVTAGGTQPLSYQWSCNATNLAGATNATLTLTNVQLSNLGNYSVAITNLYGSTNSAIAALTVVLPPMIVTQPQSKSVVSFQNAAFTVAATGTGPLSYQWRKNGTNLIDGGNISGSTTTNLNLAVVTLADAGNYDVVVRNPYATSNSVVAVLTVPQTVLTIGSTNEMSGSTVTVPVLMNALGVENAFIASVGYDTGKLVLQGVQLGQAMTGAYLQEVDSQTNNGSVGFAILLNSGAVVPAGTQEVARLVFTTLPVTNNVNTSLTFGDSPNSRQLADNNGNSLPAIYHGGTVSLTPAEYEADVSPRTNGDHQVVLQDWLEAGRMVAGLDTVTNSDEMLRADSAPRNAPDGVLTVADWVQAGRYALGLDPLTLVTPPVNSNLKITPHGQPAPTRTLQLGNIFAQRGQVVNVPVQLVCNTNENAVGMTVIYNTNQLTFISAFLGSALASGRLNVNTNMASGKVGVAVTMSPGAALAAGTNQVAVLQFLTGTNASGTVPLALDSSVIQLQVADKTAVALAANYVNGSVMLPLPPTLQTLMTGNNLQLTWPVSSGSFLVQSAGDLSGPWSNVALTLITNGSSVMVTVQATNQQQFYRLVGQ